jgi:hypothetical protein
MSFLIATPTRNRQMDVEYAVGLMHSSGTFGGWMPLTGQSDIYIARNTLANQFLHMDPQHSDLVFIDSDIAFTREDLKLLIESPHPLVSGLYPGKDANQTPVWIPEDLKGEKLPPPGSFVPAKYIPAGFLRIHRSVLEGMSKFVPEYGPVEKPNFQFFNGVIEDRNLLSEDYSFCKIAREAGFTPYVNTSIRLKHDGREFPKP